MTCNASRFWSHFAICLLTGTSEVFAVVSGLDTVATLTRSLLLNKWYFLRLGTLIARRTKQQIKTVHQVIGIY